MGHVMQKLQYDIRAFVNDRLDNRQSHSGGKSSVIEAIGEVK